MCKVLGLYALDSGTCWHNIAVLATIMCGGGGVGGEVTTEVSTGISVGQ